MPRNTAVFGPTFTSGTVLFAPTISSPIRGTARTALSRHAAGTSAGPELSAVPVVSRSGEVLGGLFFGHSRPGMFTARAERILVGIAAQAAIAIDNARLYEASQRELRLGGRPNRNCSA